MSMRQRDAGCPLPRFRKRCSSDGQLPVPPALKVPLAHSRPGPARVALLCQRAVYSTFLKKARKFWRALPRRLPPLYFSAKYAMMA